MQHNETHISGGFILLSRQLLESEIFGKPPHYLKLWIWMLMKARWQDGNSLKRGQLLTCISEMQDLGIHKIGNRDVGRFTADQVRSAYGFLVQSGAITVSKTTRGLIISIMKYDTYQTPESYEPHTVPNPARDTAAKPTANTTANPADEQPKMLGIIRECQQMSAPNPAAKPTANTGAKTSRTPFDSKERKKLESLVAPPTSKRPPSGDHQLFISWWHYAFEKTQGKPYLFAAKDAKAVKSLLTIHPIKHLVLAGCHFLTVEDAFLVNRRDLPMLVSQVNRMPAPADIMTASAARYRADKLLPPEGVMLDDWRFWEPKENHYAAA